MVEHTPYRILDDAKLENASLAVCWTQDAGRIGPGVADFLITRLNARLIGEIEPTGFFPLGGVVVENDVARFPQSKLYLCPEKDLLVFLSDTPRAEWYLFLNSIFDLVDQYCRLTEVYSVGGMITLIPHTSPHHLIGFANSRKMKETLQQYGAETTMDYETPEGQHPTINSYLLWLAKQRHINCAGLWSPVPFYLTGAADTSAWKKVLEFLDDRFELGLKFTGLDREAEVMKDKLLKARQDYPELNDYLNRLEANEGLTFEENEKLVKEIEEFLKREEE